MALAALTQEQKETAIAKANPDLRFLFDKENVDVEFQYSLYDLGVLSVKSFAVLAKDVDDLKKVLKADLGLDPEGSIRERIKAGNVVCAWEAAKARSAKALEMACDAQSRGVPADLPTNDYQNTRDAFEAKF